MQFFFFSKFLFHKPFITFQTQTSLSCISSSRTNNCRTRLLSSFFFSKNSSILYNFSLLTTYILLLYIPKCFAYHFYISQFLILESFNKTKKQVIEMSHQDFLIGKHKNIFHNLRKHTFLQNNFSSVVQHVCLIKPNIFSFPLGLTRRQQQVNLGLFDL